MKQEIKEKWLCALRSGEYKQTKGILKNDNSFCCLGVLSDIYSKETGTEWKPRRTRVPGEFEILDDNGVLPLPIMLWAGLNNLNPEVVAPSHISESRLPTNLASLNDRGVGFNDIADIIEKQL